MKLGKRHKKLICEAMAGLGGTEARARAGELASSYSVTISTIYRVTRDARPGRKARADQNLARHGVSAEALERAWGLMYNQCYTADRTVEILERNGLLERGQISPATLRRELKRTTGMGCRDLRRMTPSKIKPVRPQQTVHYSYEAEYSNQVWQIDFTVAEQFYVNDADAIGYQSPLAHRKNAPHPKGRQLWIYAVSDMYSRARFARAYPGMDSTYVLDFLYEAMRKKEDWEWDFPFYGIPDLLQSDGDSRIESKITRRTAEALAMKIRAIKANPNAQGMIERGFLTRKDIQNATRIEKLSLEAFNLMLLDDDIGYNWRKHSTTGQRPFERFMSGAERLRVVPDRELYDAMLYDELYLYIHPDLSYRVQGEQYQLPDAPPFNEMARRKVVMRWGRRTADKVAVLWKGQEFLAPVMARRFYPILGEHPYVPKKNQVERFLEAAAGRDNSDLRQWGFNLEEHRNVATLFRPREEAVTLPQAPEQMFSRTEAMEEIRRRVTGNHGLLSVEQGRFLQERIPPEGCGRDLIEELVATLTASIAESSTA